MTFAEISKKAKEAKDTLKKGDMPRISVGMASCSRAAGADMVLEAIETELKKRGIEANITRTGCIGLCFAEPNVTIFTSGETGVFYGNVTPQVAPQLIESHIINNIPYSYMGFYIKRKSMVNTRTFFIYYCYLCCAKIFNTRCKY